MKRFLVFLILLPCVAKAQEVKIQTLPWIDAIDSLAWGDGVIMPIWRADISWVHRDSLKTPQDAGCYCLETKIDTVWVKVGKEKSTGMILYDAKPDTLWRWVPK